MTTALTKRTLMATTAAAALMLTACGGAGSQGDQGNQGGGEPAPSSSAPATPTSNAPTDLSASTTASTLDGQQILGTEVTALSQADADSVGVDMSELVTSAMGEFTVEPASCKDPVLKAITGGVADKDLAEAVLMADSSGGKVTGTVQHFGDAEKAQQALEDYRSSLDACQDITLKISGSSADVTVSNQDAEVKDAAQAFTLDVEAQGEAMHSGAAAYGNALVIVAQKPTEGSAEDSVKALEEITQSLSDGASASPSASESSSGEPAAS